MSGGRFAELPRDVVRQQRRQAIAVLSLLWCFVVLAIHLPGLAHGHPEYLARHAFYHLFVAIWLALLFFRTRTVSARDVAAYWFVGLYPVAAVVFLFTKPVKWLLGKSALADAFWTPLAEEAIKVAPLLLLLWAARRRRDFHFAPSDLGLLGFAIGAGFSFHEDALWRRVAADGFDTSVFRLFFPTITDRSGGFLSAGTYAAGHGVWGALAGLGIGLWWLGRRRRGAWLLAVAPFAMVTLDHMRANARGWGKKVLDPLLLEGRLVPATLLLLLFVVVLLELMIASWGEQRERLLPRLGLGELFGRRPPGEGWRPRLDRWAAGLAYLRARSSFHLEMWRTGGTAPGRSDGSLAVTLVGLARAAGVDSAVPPAPPAPPVPPPGSGAAPPA